MIRALLRWLEILPPAEPVKSIVGTDKDPRVAKMLERQRAYGKRLRRQGRSLLSGKAYKPALTAQQPGKPESDGKVVRLRRRQV